MAAIKTLLIANRGEIAVRIIRAARELGIRTVQAYSAADANSLAVKLADVAVNIGPPQASKSYLAIDAILAAACESRADAVHPGYGFLAENADFADAVEAAGLIFVGPPGSVIRLMGDKAAAREIAAKAGVPTVPGSDGRGIRIVNDRAELDRLAPQASAEAKAAFGDGGLYLEKVIERARHIEVQVLGDGRDVVHLFERECSLQRRRQKLWEEAPAADLPDQIRARLCACAVQLARAVSYRGAGTLEFLYDETTRDFYFIEMNTRIQGEHPVTEFITGVDLVREMIKIAGGEPLVLRQADIRCVGHSIECRINAEDPAKGFMPCPGIVSGLRVPGGPGVRFDSMLYAGYAVPPFYDSLIGKLIVWDESRAAAIARLARALGEFEIEGLQTTIGLHQALARDADVRALRFDTSFLERWLETNVSHLT